MTGLTNVDLTCQLQREGRGVARSPRAEHSHGSFTHTINSVLAFRTTEDEQKHVAPTVCHSSDVGIPCVWLGRVLGYRPQPSAIIAQTRRRADAALQSSAKFQKVGEKLFLRTSTKKNSNARVVQQIVESFCCS